MPQNKLRPLGREGLRELIRTARGELPASLYIKNGTIVNVYTGELIKAGIAVKRRHIAYVGDSEKMVGKETRVIDADGYLLCPAYIEPHAHPFQGYNPATLGEKALALGTTTMVCDNLFFFMSMEPAKLLEFWRDISNWPVKLLWSVRLDPQTFSCERAARFDPSNIEPLLETVTARQVGELTDWPSLLAGKEQMLDNIVLTGQLGKRMEGHAPGASADTLNALAAAGISACHESITGEEVMRRLRLGMYATLRHSSLRQDLPQLLGEIIKSGIGFNRLMLTSDGITPPYLRHGFTDYLLRVAMDAGVPPVEAYRMVTLNPAVYYRLDDELGGIAPGRLADILFLEHIENPTPIKVMAEGEMVAENGVNLVKLALPEWSKYNISPVTGTLAGITPGDMVPPAGKEAFPVMRLVNPVITRRVDMTFPAENGKLVIEGHNDMVYGTLLGQESGWVCNGIIQGFAGHKLDGMACSNTITGDILVMGRRPADMLAAAGRMLELGGGIVLAESGKVIFELPMPLGGVMSPEPVDTLTESCSLLYSLLAERGHKHHDLLYTLLFMSATHLPEIRFSPAGIFSVKDKRVLIPVRKI